MNTPEKMKDGSATFRELEEKTSVTSEELLTTTKIYAEIGASINPRVVISLIERVPLSEPQLAEMRTFIQKGFDIQNEGREEKVAQEYKEVLEYLNRA